MSIKKQRQSGFTIIELMIASMVFSVVLLLCTYGLLQVGRMYYKGIIMARTQEAARAIMDEIAQNIQFTGEDVNLSDLASYPALGKICIGNRRYSYAEGRQVRTSTTGDQTLHGLVVDTETTDCLGEGPLPIVSYDINTTPSALALLPVRMRLSHLNIVDKFGGFYEVTVRVVYGDSEVLENPTLPSAQCQNLILSSQFCAAAELKTTVLKRLNKSN